MTKIISTNVPILLPVALGIYENYNISCDKNKQNISNINIKRVKVFAPLPQMFMKSNYLFVFHCKTT